MEEGILHKKESSSFLVIVKYLTIIASIVLVFGFS